MTPPTECKHSMPPKESFVYIQGHTSAGADPADWTAINSAVFTTCDTRKESRWARYLVEGGILYIRESETHYLQCLSCFCQIVRYAKQRAGEP